MQGQGNGQKIEADLESLPGGKPSSEAAGSNPAALTTTSATTVANTHVERTSGSIVPVPTTSGVPEKTAVARFLANGWAMGATFGFVALNSSILVNTFKPFLEFWGNWIATKTDTCGGIKFNVSADMNCENAKQWEHWIPVALYLVAFGVAAAIAATVRCCQDRQNNVAQFQTADEVQQSFLQHAK